MTFVPCDLDITDINDGDNEEETDNDEGRESDVDDLGVEDEIWTILWMQSV